jgi:hypothetical protein
MVQINIQNVEEIIFQDDKIWREMPDLRYLREQWKLSKISPILRAMGKKSLLEFLNKAKKEHENAISKYLATSVTIDKLDYFIVKNMEFSIDDAELDLNLIEAQESLYSYFGTYRKKDKIYITFWR